jgi:hypothetical protein
VRGGCPLRIPLTSLNVRTLLAMGTSTLSGDAVFLLDVVARIARGVVMVRTAEP